jgi:hypothetical protein
MEIGSEEKKNKENIPWIQFPSEKKIKKFGSSFIPSSFGHDPSDPNSPI